MGQTFCSQSACAPEASRTYRAVVCASLGSPAIKERGAGIPHTSLSLSYICIYIYINIYIYLYIWKFCSLFRCWIGRTAQTSQRRANHQLLRLLESGLGYVPSWVLSLACKQTFLYIYIYNSRAILAGFSVVVSGHFFLNTEKCIQCNTVAEDIYIYVILFYVDL